MSFDLTLNGFMSSPFDSIPEEHRLAAEQVAAYLVNVRGGAMFLSGADVRLLAQWLDEAVPVPAILCAIDRVSEKRRANRVKTRLSLNRCKGTLNKLLYKNAPKEEVEPDVATSYGEAMTQWSLAIRNEWHEQSVLVEAQRSFANRLDYAAKQPWGREAMAEHIITWINDFQDGAWAEYGSAQMHWIEDAEIELQHLKRLLTGQRWVESVEEVARDRMRQFFPLIQAQELWHRLNGVSV